MQLLKINRPNQYAVGLIYNVPLQTEIQSTFGSMRLHPQDILSQLEFDKVLLDLQSRCRGIPAKNDLASQSFLGDVLLIEQKLEEIVAFQEIMTESKTIFVTDYSDISQYWKLLEKDGGVLEIEELLELSSQLQMTHSWFEFFNKERRVRWKALYKVLSGTEPQPKIRKAFFRIFDEDKQVKDSASSQLTSVRKSLLKKKAERNRVFESELSKNKSRELLADQTESVRNGRRVLAVLSEHKRKVKGIVHDESSTGKTVFIQPENTLALDNEIFELHNEERREIRKILMQLCDDLRKEIFCLKTNFSVIIAFDIIQAKAKQANDLGINSAPKCSGDAELEWYRARHPLLLLKHKKNHDAVIPFDLKISADTKITVISGPNAGGKTITLKAVGLLCLMHQAAILTPVEDHSTMGIFDQILSDIGDQQSLDQDLSTYSSHLQNMTYFTTEADARTLFLIDEFGAGTEPTIGAALAESVLLSLANSDSRGIVTTHYGNLKILASKEPGMQNASMAFDEEALKPTFRLQTGVPGSSFAFEMANRSGLSPNIIRNARKKTGKKEGRLDYLLSNLQREKKELSEKMDALDEEKKKLDKLVRNYDRMSKELDVRRKKLKLEAKQFELQQKNRSNRELEKVIREIRENQKLEKAKELASRIKKSKKILEEETKDLHKEVFDKSPDRSSQKPFSVGDHVRMKSGGLVGTIQFIQKQKAKVIVGNMTLSAPLTDLEHSRAPIDIQPYKSVKSTVMQTNEVHHLIDVRGLRKEETLVRLEQFIDNALMANLKYLKIIHGKGNGVLKQVVREKLNDYANKFEISHPRPDQGGEGVTLVTIE